MTNLGKDLCNERIFSRADQLVNQVFQIEICKHHYEDNNKTDADHRNSDKISKTISLPYRIEWLQPSSDTAHFKFTLQRKERTILYIYRYYVCIIVWLHHLNFNETPSEKAKWELFKDAVCYFEQILEAAPYKK